VERVEFEQQRVRRQGWGAREAEQQRREMEEVERLVE
jgi:hypothetical protein